MVNVPKINDKTPNKTIKKAVKFKFKLQLVVFNIATNVHTTNGKQKEILGAVMSFL